MFLYALIITLVVFNIGIFFGYALESSRISNIQDMYEQSNIELLDQQAQEYAFDVVGDLNCSLMVQGNIDFANRIYEQALKIEKYERASRLNQDIVEEHKKYDLLRALLWMNSIKTKEACGDNFHTIVYVYKYDEPSLEEKAKQRFFSNLLGEIKEEYRDNVILIPIAGDNDLLSIELLLDKYGVEELPSIIIDEEHVLTEINNFEDIETYLK